MAVDFLKLASANNETNNNEGIQKKIILKPKNEINNNQEQEKKIIPKLIIKKKEENKQENIVSENKEEIAEEITQPIVEEQKKEIQQEENINQEMIEEKKVEENFTEEENNNTEGQKRRGRKRKNKNNQSPVVENQSDNNKEEQEKVIINTDTISSFKDALEKACPRLIDEEWEQLKQDLSEELLAIKIESDLNPAGLKHIACQLDTLKQKVWYELQAIKSTYDYLGSKEPEGLLRRVKRLNGTGCNVEEREKSGILACYNYTDEDGNAINLYQLYFSVLERYNFLNSIVEQIEFKNKLLILMNGALKLEKDITLKE